MMSSENSPLIHPSSIMELTSFVRISLLKIFKVLAVVKSGGKFPHPTAVKKEEL